MRTGAFLGCTAILVYLLFRWADRTLVEWVELQRIRARAQGVRGARSSYRDFSTDATTPVDGHRIAMDAWIGSGTILAEDAMIARMDRRIEWSNLP
jgi:hypothetical protein